MARRFRWDEADEQTCFTAQLKPGASTVVPLVLFVVRVNAGGTPALL
jgi:hypothetical protein